MKKILLLLLIFPIFLIANFKDSLTREEKIWLDNQKVISVGAMDKWEPINFLNYKKSENKSLKQQSIFIHRFFLC